MSQKIHMKGLNIMDSASAITNSLDNTFEPPLTNSSRRSSNFELLRIAAMFMIVMYHIFCHCVNGQLMFADTGGALSAGLVEYSSIYKKTFIMNTINTWKGISNDIFLLISGYFMRRNEYRVNLLKTSAKLLTQLGFAVIILMTASAIACTCAGSSVVFEPIAITEFNGMSWYLGYYFVVILIGVLFLNKFLLGLERKEYAAFLLVVLAVTQFNWSAMVLDGIGGGLSTAAIGIFLYALGGYIQKYEPFKNIRLYVPFLLIIIIYAIIYVSGYNLTQTSIVKYLHSDRSEPFFPVLLSYGNNIIIIAIAVSVFEIFKRIRMPKIKPVNFLGQSTLMIYLVHDNVFFYSIWNLKDWGSEFSIAPWRFFVNHILWAAATFAIGVLVYAAYLLFMKLFRSAKHLFVNTRT